MKIEGILATALVIGFLTVPAWGGDDPDVREQSQILVKEGVDLAHQGKLDRAIETMRKAVETDPTNAVAHTKLGYLLLDSDANDDAMKSFDEALKQNPRAHAAKTGRGIVMARAGQLDEAEAVLKDSLALNPDPVRAHYELGLVYEKKGDLQKAIAEYKEGLEKYRQGRK